MSDSLVTLLRAPLLSKGLRRKARRRAADRRGLVARFERLEDRRMLATIVLDVAVDADELTVTGPYPNGQMPTITAPLSLREAIVLANQQAVDDDVIINLQFTTYFITRDTVQGGVTSEETLADPFYGDFDISRNVTINGNGATIDANGLGRAFQITSGFDVTINNLTIRNGIAPEVFGFSQGGGIYVNGGSDVTLNNLTMHENIARGRTAQGGAVFLNNSTEAPPAAVVEINGGAYFFNAALGTSGAEVDDASGGAFHVQQGVLVVNDAQILQNLSRAASPTGSGADALGRALGGAIAVEEGSLYLDGAILDQNRAEGARGANAPTGTAGDGGEALGGAIYIGPGNFLLMETSEVTGNVAVAGAGGNGPFFAGGAGGLASGGGLYVEQNDANVGVADTIFRDNIAQAGAGGSGQDFGGVGGIARGGALAVSTANQGNPPGLVLMSVVFEENSSTGGAGGQVDDGSAGTGGASFGGAIFAGRGSIHLQDSPQLRNASNGGAGGNAFKGPAGKGGFASGGAIHLEGSAALTVVSMSSHTGPVIDPASVTVTGVMLENVATGGRGGHKLNASDSSADDSGDGGDAQGGGMAVTTSAPLILSDIMFINNGAIAGNGGNGDVFAAQGGFGTAGGASGTARGGALYAQTNLTLDGVGFSSNQALGGILEADPANGAFAGGKAGVGENLDGLSGGNGGSAMGGAVYLGLGNLAVQDSMFAGNQAIASNGGAGGAGLNFNPNAMGRAGGQGGRGGDAYGGAIRVESSGTVDLEGAWFASNTALAGRGGSGGRGADGFDGGNGGGGGNGGTAAGGALSVHPVSAPPGIRTDVDILESTFAYNKSIGGDGGFAGNGGTGNRGLGGAAGDGGHGGAAVGGAIDLNTVDGDLRRSTIQENIVSSGWGAAGGYGGSGAWIGGSLDFVDGRGGNAGDALGGGIVLLNSTLIAHTSTIVLNDVYSGFGGNGGFGGFGFLGGGNGGHGGDGGQALGGGVYNDGPAGSMDMFNVTVAQNRLIAGGGGFAGDGGGFLNTSGPSGINADVPIKYGAPESALIPILYGAETVLRPEADYLGRTPSGLIAIPSLEGQLSENSLGIDGMTASQLDTIASVSWLGALPVLSVAVGEGALGAFLALTITTTTAGEIGFGTSAAVAGTTSITGFGIAAVSFGGIAITVSTFAIGAVVATKFVWAGFASGDWEGAAAFALGTPGDVTGRHLNVLLQGVLPNEDDDPPEPGGPGVDGQPGDAGQAAGTNVWGSARLNRSLIAEGGALVRSRSRSIAPVVLDANTYYVSESIANVSLADIAGGSYESFDPSLIGAVDSGFVNDLHGTTAEPLDAKLDSQTRFNGGTTPTLRLLPTSPARNIEFGSVVYTSQNDYQWGFFYDLGAWGHGFNQSLTAEDDAFQIQEGGILNFKFEDLLVNDDDLDDDPLTVANNQLVGPAQHGMLVYIEDLESGELTIQYKPNAGFAGIETFTYLATDGQFASEATITITVVPALPGDFDVDNDVDGADFLAWQRGLGATTGATRAQGDANADGAVDAADLAIWKANYGDTLPAVAAAQPAFAPASVLASPAVAPKSWLVSGRQWSWPVASPSPLAAAGRAQVAPPRAIDEALAQRFTIRGDHSDGDRPSNARALAAVDVLLADRSFVDESGEALASQNELWESVDAWKLVASPPG